MKTYLLSLIVLAALILSGEQPLRAQEPPKPPRIGKVLVLKNEHVIEGDIEHVGDRYRVRRAVGETWVPEDRVLRLVASLADAYVFLRGRINLEDPDERLRLARWCRLNGLREQTLTELRAAVVLRPDHAETLRLLERLKQEAQTMPSPKKSEQALIQSDEKETMPVEVTTEALGVFATRVQPILMNACARCHATGNGGKFQLRQVYDGGIGNRRTLERNLAAVLAEVNLNQPQTSRLLLKAVSDHAHVGQSPLRDRQVPPYRTLESWIKLTVANNPHLRDVLPPPASTPEKSGSHTFSPPSATRRSSTEESEWGTQGRPASTSENPTPTQSSTPSEASEKKTAPASGTTPDPYDPEPFNQRAHPQSNKPGPGK